jgi:hypothetical protein
MKSSDPQSPGRLLGELKSSLAYLAFGVAVLAFLAVTGRAEWFRLRPATGTAAALSYAAQPPNTSAPHPVHR